MFTAMVLVQSMGEAMAKGFVSAVDALAVGEGKRLTRQGIPQLGAFRMGG